MGPVNRVQFREVHSGVMSGTKLTPNRALANACLGTIKINTQFGCHPHWALVNAQLGFLTPNSET